ncbi:MAG: hypothetical protein PHQ22_09020 [Sulfuricurvum sp.]|nr:hypothetical protein [Sulfuricurvum sp.]
MFKFFFLVFITSVVLLAADTSLASKLKSQHLTVAKESLKKNSELIGLIADTDSMDAAEKQYWLKELPNLADEQIKRLLEVLRSEKQKLDALDKQYAEESHALDIKQSREWIEKLDELLASDDAAKPNKEMLLGGMEMIDFYLQNGESDEALLEKMVHIADATLADSNLTDGEWAKTHYSAYRIHATYPNFSHLSQKRGHLQECVNLSRKIDQERNDPEFHSQVASLLMALSYVDVCAQDFSAAIRESDEAITYDKTIATYANVNKAHALMFMGKSEEAKKLYLQSLRSKVKEEIVAGLQQDTADFRALGLALNVIEQIEKITAEATKKGKK